MESSIDERFKLIKRNTQEIVTEDELKELLKKKKNPVVYWGTAVTGKPSLAYFFPLLKLSDFSKAGFKVKVLLADLHGALDGTPWTILERRYEYYEEAITQIFKALGTDLKRRIEVMNPMIPGLIGKKMSSSDPKSKIDLTDSYEEIKQKINKADMAEGEPDNGVMAFLKYVIMVIKEDNGEKFLVKRDKKWGGDLLYNNYEEIEKDFAEKKLHPQDLKNAVAVEIIK